MTALQAIKEVEILQFKIQAFESVLSRVGGDIGFSREVKVLREIQQELKARKIELETQLSLIEINKEYKR